MTTETLTTFSDLGAIRVLFNTIENLAAEAIELKDDASALRASMLWSIQKMAEVAQADIARMDPTA